LDAIRFTPRHVFVDEALASHAYDNTALPIGFGQTISQPYIVARMSQYLLQHGKIKKVLEIGTGCGYQAAILAQLVDEVYSIERLQNLSVSAAKRLKSLGLHTVQCRHGDGYLGWAEAAPFDAIIVTAAAPEIPPALIKQLAPQARMIIPIGDAKHNQQLICLTHTGQKNYQTEILEDVHFVPMLNSLG
jgi:protein-L-isoaspartate(D-aspartate) O-methyltransferase